MMRWAAHDTLPLNKLIGISAQPDALHTTFTIDSPILLPNFDTVFRLQDTVRNQKRQFE
jgi:hypothetical protein